MTIWSLALHGIPPRVLQQYIIISNGIPTNNVKLVYFDDNNFDFGLWVWASVRHQGT